MGAVIEVDAVRKMIAGLSWSDPKQHEQAIRVAASTALLLHRELGRPVVLVDALDDRHMLALRSRDDVRRARVAWIGLWANAEVHRARRRGRAKACGDGAICRALNEQLERTSMPDEVVVDSSNLTAEQTADRICALIGAPGST